MGLYDFSFYDLINRNAVAFGDRICWQEIDDGRQVSFAEYKRQVDRLAVGLAGAGIKKGDRVGVVGKNSFEFFLIYGAAAALGAIVLPVNWRLSADEMAFNLNDCQAKIAFVDGEFQAALAARREKLPSVTAYLQSKGRWWRRLELCLAVWRLRLAAAGRSGRHRRLCHYPYRGGGRSAARRLAQSWQYSSRRYPF